MRNPFVALAVAAMAQLQAVRSQAILAFNRGEFSPTDDRPSSYSRKTGMTVAAAKRAAVKAKNRARHRAACRG